MERGDHLGKYLLNEKLGEGTFAFVFSAQHTILKKTLALKILKPAFVGHSEYLARFLGDAQAAAALDHPNIVRVYDVYKEPVPHIAMEYIEGATLSRLLLCHELSTSHFIRIGIEIASALEAAHAANIVHRDVKPANILIERASGRAKLADFNVARLLREDEPNLTLPGMEIGTPRYMAPEQWRGEQVDGRTDLFALGATIYECLTGVTPFSGRNPEELRQAILKQEPPRLGDLRPDVPAELAKLVHDMLQKSINMRPQNAQNVHRVLASIGISSDASDSKAVTASPFAHPEQALLPRLFPAARRRLTMVASRFGWRTESRVPPHLVGMSAMLIALISFFLGLLYLGLVKPYGPTHPTEPIEIDTRLYTADSPTIASVYDKISDIDGRLPTAWALRDALADDQQLRSEKDNDHSDSMLGENWMEVQGGLAALGYNPGSIDGDPGPQTMAALNAWRESRSYNVNGPLLYGQYRSLVDIFYFSEIMSRVRTKTASPRELHELGIMYLFGRGTSSNAVTAAHWIELASSLGDIEATNTLGVLYFYGLSADHSEVNAADLFRSAAASGNVEAQKNLARIFYLGRGVPRDVTTAIHLYAELVVDSADEWAANEIIGILKGGPGPYDLWTSIDLLGSAAANRNMNAAYVLGRLYRDGLGVDVDQNKALAFFRLSAGQHSLAAFEIASMHLMGQGASREDYEAAVSYLQQRASDYDDYATDSLIKLGITPAVR